MTDIRSVVSLFEIALGAGELLFLVLIFSSMYRMLGHFLKALTCLECYALNSIFLRAKRLRYVTVFPKDLRRVLANDTIINEYFREQYFTDKDFLEMKELYDLPEYDETSELLDELASHLKEPHSIRLR